MGDLDLSNFFQTKAQATDFSTRLATIAEQTYQTTFTVEKALAEQFGILKKDALLGLFRDNNVSIDSPKAIKDFIEKVQATIVDLPVVPLTLAFIPKEQTLKILSEWFLMQLKKQVLFDISVDHNLIAGAAITFNGKYKDFSIKAAFDKTVNNVLTQPTTTHALPNAAHNRDSLHLGR